MTRFPVEVLPPAEAEVREAFLWYFERSPLAADASRTEALDAIDALAESADASSDVLGATFRAGGGHLGQTLRHARLPARPGGAPALDDLRRQAQTDQLTRVG